MLANTAEEIRDKNLNNVSRVNTEEGELEERASLRSPNEQPGNFGDDIAAQNVESEAKLDETCSQMIVLRAQMERE